VSDQRVGEVGNFIRRIDEWKQTSEELQLTVKTGDLLARVVEVPRQKTK